MNLVNPVGLILAVTPSGVEYAHRCWYLAHLFQYVFVDLVLSADVYWVASRCTN